MRVASGLRGAGSLIWCKHGYRFSPLDVTKILGLKRTQFLESPGSGGILMEAQVYPNR